MGMLTTCTYHFACRYGGHCGGTNEEGTEHLKPQSAAGLNNLHHSLLDWHRGSDSAHGSDRNMMRRENGSIATRAYRETGEEEDRREDRALHVISNEIDE